MDAVTLHHGDALDVLRGMADNSVDAVVTDPPAGISMMGKTWDHDHGGRDGWVAAFAAIFAEALRVTKPGGHALVWALPRTSHWTACALEDAGWEIRDCVAHLFGSGFPKSLDVGKAIDKAAGVEREVVGEGPFASRRPRADHDKQGLTFADDGYIRPPGHTLSAPATDAARQWDGWGTALKPAIEFWWLARKPLVGTVAANVLAHGTGGLNIEACRVGTADGDGGGRKMSSSGATLGRFDHYEGDGFAVSPAGRWPANLCLSHAPGCERVGTRRVRVNDREHTRNNGARPPSVAKGQEYPHTTIGYADAEGMETVDDWRCVEGCPVRALGEQSGVSESKRSMRGLTGRHDPGQGAEHNRIKPYSDGERGHADTGTAARIFSTFEPSPLDDVTPFLYTAKASRREREAGLEGMEMHTKRILNGGIPSAVNSDSRGMSGGGDREARNHHPTVKPLALMRWLVRLVTPPGGVVLDPFTGSGTTGMAAVMEGFAFIGIEQDAEYIEIARRRIAWAQEQQPPLLRATGD